MSEASTATCVVISYPESLGDWSRDQLTGDRFRSYFRRTLGDVEVGEEFTEFVDVGCCGNSPDIPLRVEAVEGEGPVGDDTDIAFTTREVDVASGWRVQSAAGPNR
ncbi:hypothetical protein ACFO0N_03090 [Halobium salinum]|uniref:DUF7968 domain-containing protein n=1 Tax=Halobium salinum TaxID=1364940 RepID=A0ABD5P7Q9_9EURY|nr:hypothetical protein [Halobium salinum]